VLSVEATKTHATYVLLEGAPIEIRHHGKPIRVATDAPVTEEIPPAPSRPAPTQPDGRAPARRGKTDG
jgi:alpha,alpha-trehalose phosphorylase